MKHSVYLIQRGKFQRRDFKQGIDSILSFDYMGSSEFEFGALGKSLKRVRDLAKDYIILELSLNDKKPKNITVVCKKEDANEIPDILIKLSKEKIFLKERCDFYNYIYPETKYASKSNTDFWWDIENDYFFFRQNNDFLAQFLDKLGFNHLKHA